MLLRGRLNRLLVFLGKRFYTFGLQKRRLVENFLSMSVLQVANYIFPLITLPYLVRVLGPEKFGLISFAQAFTQYFNILTDYGFNLSATRDISINRDDKGRVSEVFSSVMMVKLGLLVLSFVVMSVVVFFFERFEKEWLVYYLSFGMVIGRSLLPYWFFQGMESMRYIMLLNVTSRAIFTVSIFVFVHEVSDYIYVPLLNSLGVVTVGVIALWIVHSKFKVGFLLPNMVQIVYRLKSGWYVFVSDVAISLYTVSNAFLLGLFTNDVIVGYYSAYEKIVRSVVGLFQPVIQTVYPFFNRLYEEDLPRFKKYYGKLFRVVGLLSVVLTMMLVLFAREIVVLLLGEVYLRYLAAFYVMSLLVTVVPVACLISDVGLLSLKLDREFMKIYLLGGVVNLFLIFTMLGYFRLSILGAVASLIFTEFTVTLVAYVVLRRRLSW